MLSKIFAFEVRYHLGQPLFAITAVIFALLTFGAGICLPHERMSNGHGGTQQVDQQVDGGDGAQLGGAQNAHNDGLSMSTVERAIAA